jgi:phosphoenolpyruvate carboxykinase (ATP)
MPIRYTRAIVHAALNGKLDSVPTRTDPTFGFSVPVTCPGVPNEILDPRITWRNKEMYDAQARRLAAMFKENFKDFESDVSDAIRKAGPIEG